jgi:hypothetical protein
MLLEIVKALDAVPVPTVMPRPPYPPVAVVKAFVIKLPFTADETKPVSSEIAVGD